MSRERTSSSLPAGFGPPPTLDQSVFNCSHVRNADAAGGPRRACEADSHPQGSPNFYSTQVQVQVTHASIESDLEKVSVHSNRSVGAVNLPSPKSSGPGSRRHSLPAIALDKVKSLLTSKNQLSMTPPLELEESLISRRKRSIIGLFNTIGTNLGLVTPKRSISNLGSIHGSTGSVDLLRLRHSLEMLEMSPSPRNLATVPITSIDEIYYRPHRSFVRDILCCICFKKHDEYDNLIESHSCARIFTALVLLTIFCMLVGYFIKAAGEKS